MRISLPIVRLPIAFMTKNRVPISADQAAEAMFASDRTCCVCNERGKTVQIHHVDDDPSNNGTENLAVLCLECHNDTQTKGGFGRRLNSDLVIKYRNEWLLRVSKRRDEADSLAVSKVSGVKSRIQQTETIPYSDERELVGDLLRFGADVEVLEPAELRAKVKRAFHDAAGRYM